MCMVFVDGLICGHCRALYGGVGCSGQMVARVSGRWMLCVVVVFLLGGII